MLNRPLWPLETPSFKGLTWAELLCHRRCVVRCELTACRTAKSKNPLTRWPYWLLQARAGVTSGAWGAGGQDGGGSEGEAWRGRAIAGRGAGHEALGTGSRTHHVCGLWRPWGRAAPGTHQLYQRGTRRHWRRSVVMSFSQRVHKSLFDLICFTTVCFGVLLLFSLLKAKFEYSFRMLLLDSVQSLCGCCCVFCQLLCLVFKSRWNLELTELL